MNERELEYRIGDAMEAVEAGLADCRADFGEEALDAGAWVEIVRNVALQYPKAIASEVLRRHGLKDESSRRFTR